MKFLLHEIESSLRLKPAMQHCIAVQLLYQLTGRGEPFCYTKYGKPYWEEGPYFNYSHCLSGIIVAVSEKPVGVDIESYRHFDEELMRRVMNEEECRDILNDAEPPKRFIYYWTRKEAYLKYKGVGITEDLRDCLRSADAVQLETVMGPRYCYTICVPNEQ